MEKHNVKRFEESCYMGSYRIVVAMYNGARAGEKMWQGLGDGRMELVDFILGLFISENFIFY